MLSCLKTCISPESPPKKHPKDKRKKTRPGYIEKQDTVVLTPVCLSQGNASTSSFCLGENVVLACEVTPVRDDISQVEEEDVRAEDTDDDGEEELATKVVMGMTEESTVHAELASATIPKERKFQVVRVPGVFTRGRWKCWDYREDVKPVEGLTFTDDKENDSAGTVTVTASTSVSTTASEPPPPTSTHSPQREESSTIVVTSIAPAPPTPQHGTPSSISEMPTPPYTFTEVHAQQGGDWMATTPTTVTITSAHPPTDTVVVQSVAPPSSDAVMVISTVAPSSVTPSPSTASMTFDVMPPPAATVLPVVPSMAPPQMTATSVVRSSIVVEEIREPEREQQQQQVHQMQQSEMTQTTPIGSNEMGGTAIGAVPSSSFVPSSTTASPPSAPSSTPSPEMTRSGSEGVPPAAVEEEPASAAPAMSNAAAIDNKIEQAMDLVKTHLTFAVREEVEILRTTIAELESRVSTLETQNAYLKRHVTPEVLASLPGMIQQHKMSLPATAAPVHLHHPSAISAPSSSVSPSLAAAAAAVQQEVLQSAAAEAAAAAAVAASTPYCPATTNFANSLSTVVYPQPPSAPSSQVNPR
ncbi:hypothetical protein PFISCL1PPCAC_26159 [Pristionchus fissidentatus]|uniref:Uncharacterized protein n=1 Tax=Pristionchus fissidentatus TaxID=1538716 RepID=A0AAV5WUW7_9BILA|nr:hypothetical protein PFISCL1PPCAC_26159 [Pristionchus fissidentatus]